MPSPGEIFKSARERKRVSLSQAAARTRIKVQILEGMERNDFSHIPAPAYAKGFIRMYAEFLGLDATPLVNAYVAEYQVKPRGKNERPAPAPAPEPAKAPAKEPAAEPAEPAAEAPARTGGLFPAGLSWQRPAMLVGSVLVVVVLAAALSRCPAKDEEKPAKAAPPAPAQKRNPLALIQEPPEPYIHVAGFTTNQP